MQNNERIVQLLYRRLKGSALTVEENQELDTWLARSESNRRIFENLSDKEWLKEAKKRYDAPGKEAGLAQLRDQLFAEPAAVVRTFPWVRVVGYAATLLIIFTTIYILVPTKQAFQVALTELNNQLFIAPGGDAISTLSNGTNIQLHKQVDGLLAKLSGGKQLLKQDGKLVYQSAIAQSTAGEVDYSSSPRSDQYSVNSVVLPDGSRAWLNRGSTLHFPEQFATDKRVVELDGEAYFEIAKAYSANGKDRLPFIVKLPAQSNSSEPCEVEVLGTHFNIYAHKDEPIRTTLTEGKVRMSRGQETQMLSPGQQAVVESEHIAISDNIKVDEVLAWKNNEFRYENASIHTIMRDLERWYGNHYVIDGEIKNISLICDRNKPLSELLNQLNESGKAHFKMDGSTIVVEP